jgi:TusA-related sulfurtransferase
MSKDRKKQRSASNAVILKILADKYNVTEQYARVCSKGFSESEKATEIQKEYKILKQKLNNLSK